MYWRKIKVKMDSDRGKYYLTTNIRSDVSKKDLFNHIIEQVQKSQKCPKSAILDYKDVTFETASDLKYWHEDLNRDSYYFTRKTMRFFGDTMKNYGIRWYKEGDCWELYRRRPVKFGCCTSVYFDCQYLKHSTQNPIMEDENE